MFKGLILEIIQNSLYQKYNPINNKYFCSCDKQIIFNKKTAIKSFIKCKCNRFNWFLFKKGYYPIFRLFKPILIGNELNIVQYTYFVYFDGNSFCSNSLKKHITLLNLTIQKNLTPKLIYSFFHKINFNEITHLIDDLERYSLKNAINPNYGYLLKQIRIKNQHDFINFLYIALKFNSFELLIKSGYSKFITSPHQYIKNIHNKLSQPHAQKLSLIFGLQPKVILCLKAFEEPFKYLESVRIFIAKFGFNKFGELVNNQYIKLEHLKKISYILESGYNFKKLLAYIENIVSIGICSKSSTLTYCIENLCNCNCRDNYLIKNDINLWLDIIHDTLLKAKSLKIKQKKYNKYILNEYNLLLQINDNYIEKTEVLNSHLECYYHKISAKIKQVNGDYLLLCPQTIKDFQVEELKMKNCITTYIKNVISNQSIILFLHKKNGSSYMTLEINQNNQLIQAKKRLNVLPNQKDLLYLNKLAQANDWTLVLNNF